VSLTPFITLVLIGVIIRFVRRSRSYVRIEPDGVHIRDYPRNEAILSLGDINRFEAGQQTNGVTLLRRDGELVRPVALRKAPRNVATQLNNRLAAVRDGQPWQTSPSDLAAERPSADLQSAGRGSAILAHLGIFICAVVVPLIVMQTAGQNDPWTRQEAIQALNFQSTAVLWAAIAFFVAQVPGGTATTLLYILDAVVTTAGFANAVVAALHASRGERGRYWVSIPFVR